MPGQIVNAGNLLTAGLRSDFWDVYERTYAGMAAKLGQVMQLDVPSDKLTEIYGYFLSAPYPRRWVRGQEIESSSFKSVQFNVTNKDYGIRVSWHNNDLQDDQTRSLFDRARAAGMHFATLTERIFYQIVTNTTDNLLLQAIPNAPDGVALYSATDGESANRFGVSGGNIVTGTGVATPVAIRADFFDAIERFRQFQDTESQPLFDDAIIDGGFIITFNVANWQVFAEAFAQGRTLAAATTATSNAAVTNIILDSGLKVELWPTQRITDNDWFVFLKSSPKKPIFRQVRQAIREAFGTFDTSDQARGTKVEYIQWDSREGYGVMLPYGSVKVNN